MAKSKAGKAFKIIGLIVLLIVIFCVLSLFGIFNVKSSWFTEEQHLKRISNRVEKKYIKRGKLVYNNEVTDFEVYPLYNENEEFTFAIIEYEPSGCYSYVDIREEVPLLFICVGLGMYMEDGHNYWKPYESYDDMDYPIYLIDKNGEEIKYEKSPYAINGKEKEKRYLLSYYSNRKEEEGYIPAVKRNNKFINLISNKEIKMVNGKIIGEQAYEHIAFYNYRKAYL